MNAQKAIQLAAEYTTEPLLVADTERVRYVNQAFANLIGVPRSEIEAKEVDQVVTILEEPLVVDRLRNALRQGQPFRGETSCLSANGDVIPIDLAVFPVTDETESLFVVSARDLRPLKHLEHRLWQSQRLDAVATLTDGIAHEMNNVIHVLAGYKALLTKGVTGAAPSGSDLIAIEEAARRGELLLRDLLDFARRRPPARGPIDLNGVIAHWRDLLTIMVGADIRLILDFAPDLPTIYADRSEIQHILLNLVTNARAAMPHGGTLTITTHAVIPEQAIHQEAVEEWVGRYVVLSVADTGSGMSPETRGRALDGYAGGGLGLPTVQGIVREAGGLLWIRTTPNAGTSVEIHFQALEHPPASPPGTADHPAEPPGGHETILLVDDDPLVLRVARRGLEQVGYRVLAAQGAAEATTLAAEHGPDIALLVTDVMMPGQRGTGLAAELTAEWPHLRVLFISGYPGATAGSTAALQLNKPFSPDELAVAIRQVLGGA
jgi:two-component system cell cycle sensor histidine kinase/response regulator CckA